MTFKTRTIVAFVATLAVAGSALAQGGGGGRGGFGGGQRGFGGGQMGGFAMSESMIVNRPDVQKDIKLTDEQKKKLEDARTEMAEKMRAQFQNGGGFTRGSGSGGTTNGQAGTEGPVGAPSTGKPSKSRWRRCRSSPTKRSSRS